MNYVRIKAETARGLLDWLDDGDQPTGSLREQAAFELRHGLKPKAKKKKINDGIPTKSSPPEAPQREDQPRLRRCPRARGRAL
jgi:hypothetical protein